MSAGFSGELKGKKRGCSGKRGDFTEQEGKKRGCSGKRGDFPDEGREIPTLRSE